MLAGGFLLVNFHRTATAVLAETLAATVGATGAELGSLHASFSYIYAALQLPAGLVVDRYGPRRVGGVGLAAMTAGVVWFGASGSLAEALLARAAIGLGGSVLYIATLRFCANWFRPDEYATMTGYTIAAAGVGGIALAFTVGKERHESDIAGTVTGVINSLGYFGAAVLPTVLGAVLDAYWTGEVTNGAQVYTVTGYRVAFGIATIAGVLATGATVWLHRRHSRRAPGSEAAATGD